MDTILHASSTAFKMGCQVAYASSTLRKVIKRLTSSIESATWTAPDATDLFAVAALPRSVRIAEVHR